MDEPPPPYSTVPQNEIYKLPLRLNAPKHLRAHLNEIESATSPDTRNNHRFPQKFGLYNTLGKTADIFIAQHAKDPHALFYISTHTGTNSPPRISLYSYPYESSAPLATASFDFFAQTVAIKLFDNSTSIIKAQSAQTPTAHMIFIARLQSSDSKEQFEWKSNSYRDKILSNYMSNGMKLVNSGTGETVAIWTRASFSHKKLGKMRFLTHDRSILGERFELMAVVTLLSILVKEREVRNNF